MSGSKVIVATAALWACCSAADAGLMFLLDADNQTPGNVGLEYRPVDSSGNLAPFLMTARSMIDRDAPFDPLAKGNPGTIFFGAEGTGVQGPTGGGSEEISGIGGFGDEELIFSFDVKPADADSIMLGLSRFDPGSGLNSVDDVVLFVGIKGVGTIVLDETEYMSAFVPTGTDEGYIDFSLLGLGPGAKIQSLVVRETNKHMFVNFLGLQPIPGPGGLALLGVASALGAGSRRRRRASC